MDSFDSFPAGNRRRDEVSSKERSAKTLVEAEGKNAVNRYTWRNSPLEGEYVPNIGMSFAESFYDTFYDNKGIRHYIEKILKAKAGKAIGIEFGGVGENLFSGFTSGFFVQSVGVTLIDHRDHEKTNEPFGKDSEINHKVLEGNIFDSSTYKSLNKILENKKVDLIMERMGRGLEFVPIEPYSVSRILEVWYELLNEGGVMFIQVPVEFNYLLKAWIKKIEEEFKDVIKIEYKIGYNDCNNSCSAFCLRKLAGAPNKLPLLDPRILKEIPKNN